MCPEQINPMIEAVDWSQYETAYGNAVEEKTKSFFCKRKRKPYHVNVPMCLRKLFADDTAAAVHAASDLCAALCHQHVYVSSSALPAYEMLLYCLQTTDCVPLQEALMDIFYGFTVCTKTIQQEWAAELRRKLERDEGVFQHFLHHENEIIADFAADMQRMLSSGKMDVL